MGRESALDEIPINSICPPSDSIEIGVAGEPLNWIFHFTPLESNKSTIKTPHGKLLFKSKNGSLDEVLPESSLVELTRVRCNPKNSADAANTADDACIEPGFHPSG